MLKIETRIDPCEISGERIRSLPEYENQLSVKNHNIDNQLVVLSYRDALITVSADELHRAINNAVNH